MNTEHELGIGSGNPELLVCEAGFSLLETLIALGVLATGLIGLAGVFTIGLASLAAAGPDIVAREKASEAIESVYTARDTRTVTWATIRNVKGATGSDGGVFLDGETPLKTAGKDGLLNTADDGKVEARMLPGPDSKLGTEDDIAQELSGFTREIQIRDMETNLRRIRVVIRYYAGNARREYVLETLISSFA
jgi:hypothetical protein